MVANTFCLSWSVCWGLVSTVSRALDATVHNRVMSVFWLDHLLSLIWKYYCKVRVHVPAQSTKENKWYWVLLGTANCSVVYTAKKQVHAPPVGYDN